MERQTYGWVRSNISGTYHYISDERNKTAPCGFSRSKITKYYKIYEILNPLRICSRCERAINLQNSNIKKSKLLDDRTYPTKTENYILKNTVCSENGCSSVGVALAPTHGKEKPMDG